MAREPKPTRPTDSDATPRPTTTTTEIAVDTDPFRMPDAIDATTMPKPVSAKMDIAVKKVTDKYAPKSAPVLVSFAEYRNAVSFVFNVDGVLRKMVV